MNRINYTLCADNSTANYPPINDTRLIKKIYLKTDDEITNLTNNLYLNYTPTPYLFIADKGNNCIRILDLSSRTSKTYAGICSQQGFKDGLLGDNLFFQPESLGVDLYGNVFVFDSGNQYIRLIKTNGCVVTLVPGACRRDFRFDSKVIPGRSLKNDYVTCYREWMNSTSGDSVCYSQNQQSFCYDEIFLCPNNYSPFIYKNITN